MTQHISNEINYSILSGIFDALKFAAHKHRRQKRKGRIGIPYINHPIEVASLLISEIREPSSELLTAAILHDVIEDTRTKFSDLEKQFGASVTNIVKEVTDDMTLPSLIRKREQVKKVSSLSYNARCIKIADKTCNINDLLFTRIKWSRRRKVEYIEWANNVISQIRDTHKGLITRYDETILRAASILNYSFDKD